MREEKENLLLNLDLLVLPELAFAGYNHPSLDAIAPYLEPTAAGPSTRWATRTAKRLQCTVAVGYAEAAEGEGNWNTNFDGTIRSEGGKGFNSLVFVDWMGEVVAHYRKSFLYYTDETWAKEGGGFFSGVLPLGVGGRRVKVAAGICMDINPYRFESEWTEYEFANFVKGGRVKLVVVSMAWLTRLERAEMTGEGGKGTPDMNTVGYWVERFRPLIGPNGLGEEVIVVCANRTGEEGIAERIGEVRYAGSSCVMGLTKGDGLTEGNVRIWDIMGRAQEGVMIVDTEKEPRFAVTKKAPAWNGLGDEPVEANGLGTVLGDATQKASGRERASEHQSTPP